MERVIKDNVKPLQKEDPHPLLVAWLLMLFASLAYIGSEWLFLVTKPSSISILPTFQKIAILGFGVSLLTLAGCFIQTFLYLPYCLCKKKNDLFIKLLILIPAVVIAITVLLLIDNFTYTTMGFGIVTSKGFIRVLYSLGFILFSVYLTFRLSRLHQSLTKALRSIKKKKRIILFITLVALIFTAVSIVLISAMKDKASLNVSDDTSLNKKNVVLITAEGLNAENMSIYGYEKDTTPFLKSISSKLFISQNNFTNSGNTTGSISSILTSKHPTNLRVLYRPDILRGEDAYQSLPAILKNKGYYCAQYSLGYYADAFAINFKNAFDYANGRSAKSKSLLGIQNLPIPTNLEYFLYELEGRLTSRLQHIFMIQEMENEYRQVAEFDSTGVNFGDRVKLENAVDILFQAKQPVFLHIHWMKSHGPQFQTRNRVFSAHFDPDQQGNWNMSFYEDAILDFDEDMEFLYTKLEELDILNDTVIVIGTDHGKRFVTNVRVPLLILFPNKDHAREIHFDTQNLDIAPTILDYLGADIPKWMEGNSLLNEVDGYRPIISVRNNKNKQTAGNKWELDDAYNNPPFFQFDVIGLQNCGIWTRLDLEEYDWKQMDISAYEPKCESKDILDNRMIRDAIISRLHQDGFEFEESLIPALE